VTRNRILVVDDDTSLRRVMKMQLEEAGYEVSIASDGSQAYSMLKDLQPTLIITDLRMPTSGLELLGRIAQEEIQTTVIVITAFGTVDTAVEAMKMGAYDYVTKPLDFDALVLVVHRAMERQNLLEAVRTLRSALDQRYGFDPMERAGLPAPAPGRAHRVVDEGFGGQGDVPFRGPAVTRPPSSGWPLPSSLMTINLIDALRCCQGSRQAFIA